jgi:hypothetical protein
MRLCRAIMLQSFLALYRATIFQSRKLRERQQFWVVKYLQARWSMATFPKTYQTFSNSITAQFIVQAKVVFIS